MLRTDGGVDSERMGELDGEPVMLRDVPAARLPDFVMRVGSKKVRPFRFIDADESALTVTK